MNHHLLNNGYKSLSILLFCLLFFSGCDRGEETAETKEMEKEKAVTSTMAVKKPAMNTSPTPQTEAKIEVADNNLNIGNSQYLFVAAEHTVEELQALLQRVEEITKTESESYDQLDIDLIIHGKNIEMFTQENYEQNKSLIDLAAKLDAYNVLDMKVCEWSMSQRGLSPTEIPSFVEPVPFAPDEIRRLREAGYIKL